MKKSDLLFMPEFYDRYINLVEDEELIASLENSLNELENIDIEELESLKDKVYAPNKWTIKDILQHLIDNERVQVYRALRFARNDRNHLQGYDQNLFGNNTAAKKRTVKDLLEEFILVRKGTIHLFKSFTNWMLRATGRANGIELTVLAIGFTLVGHQKHHIKIIKERYLPLLAESR